jgi:hypothetical protein
MNHLHVHYALAEPAGIARAAGWHARGVWHWRR